eukprot:CAMPEP_0185745090 /NCGR_PEP_ID=MMETSP1174-20130828/3380_1 /TAXON_ID=35687 /ORGANISM="Dictyocha speculum, Strain CCMP1381" /LENGTH=102 /DNA_ID=CAMNT_0028418887 /DNA_START=37 /DNA_END=341 /DNA_ORIENTATION=+
MAARTRPELETMTNKELKELCKAANVPMTGTKDQLISFILDPANNQKGKRKASGNNQKGKRKAPGSLGINGYSKAAKAAREISGPGSTSKTTDTEGDKGSTR